MIYSVGCRVALGCFVYRNDINCGQYMFIGCLGVKRRWLLKMIYVRRPDNTVMSACHSSNLYVLQWRWSMSAKSVKKCLWFIVFIEFHYEEKRPYCLEANYKRLRLKWCSFMGKWHCIGMIDQILRLTNKEKHSVALLNSVVKSANISLGTFCTYKIKKSWNVQNKLP